MYISGSKSVSVTVNVCVNVCINLYKWKRTCQCIDVNASLSVNVKLSKQARMSTMSVCLYVCMSVCLYTFMPVSPHVSMSVCLYACMPICLYVLSLYVCMYVCMSVCMPLCMAVCMYVCLYVCFYVSMYFSMFVCLFVRLLARLFLTSFRSLGVLYDVSQVYFAFWTFWPKIGRNGARKQSEARKAFYPSTLSLPPSTVSQELKRW